MSHPVLARHLKKNVLQPVYLWYGEEDFLIRRALARLEDWLQEQDELAARVVLDAAETPLAEAVAVARSPQLWGGRQLVVLWEVERYKAQELAALEKYLAAPAEQSCLILIAPGLKHKDVQSHRLWRRLLDQEAALGFARLREGDLPGWLEREAKLQGKSLGPGAARALVEAVGANLTDLHQELEKLVLYVGANPTISMADVGRVSSHSRAHTIFELVEALGQSRPDKALKVLDRLLELGEPPPRVLVMLARQLRLLLRTQEGMAKKLGTEQLARELKVPRFVVEKLQKQAVGFGRRQLEGQLIRLHEADQNLKTGMVAPRLLLEQIILDMCPSLTLRNRPSGH